MKIYEELEVGGRVHVVCNLNERLGYPLPNYMNTGKALCGVLKNGQSLADWIVNAKTVRE